MRDGTLSTHATVNEVLDDVPGRPPMRGLVGQVPVVPMVVEVCLDINYSMSMCNCGGEKGSRGSGGWWWWVRWHHDATPRLVNDYHLLLHCPNTMHIVHEFQDSHATSIGQEMEPPGIPPQFRFDHLMQCWSRPKQLQIAKFQKPFVAKNSQRLVLHPNQCIPVWTTTRDQGNVSNKISLG